ncbi:MAG: lipopolysaccharide assembly protein LapA domain-containing protein [Acidimicrobiales bacterium]
MTVPDGLGREHEAPEPKGNRRRDARLVVTGVLIALAVWFALANTQEVKIRFWVVSTRSPVVTALAIAAAFGAGIGLLLGRRFRRPSP